MASKYCPNCSYSNEPDRGACLMCHALLPVAAVGEQQRPEVAEAAGAPRGIEAMAAVVVEAAEGLSGGVTTGLLPAEATAEKYAMEALEGPEGAELAEEVAQAQEPVPAEERAEAEAPEEEYAPPPPPPGTIDLGEEALPVTTALEAEQAEDEEGPRDGWAISGE